MNSLNFENWYDNIAIIIGCMHRQTCVSLACMCCTIQNVAMLERKVKSLQEELKESKAAASEAQKQQTHLQSIK